MSVGLGLRSCHFSYIEKFWPRISFFEILADNFFNEYESCYSHLENIRAHYPVTLHSVGLSLGSTDPLNQHYLLKLKTLCDQLQPELVSDHLCWTSLENQYFHDLLPLPYTQEAVDHVSKRIQQVQDFLKREIIIENVSTYLTFPESEMDEWDFLQAVVEDAGAKILLDVNNIYVSAKNTGFNPEDYLNKLNKKNIVQFHLGGFENKETHLLDTHGANIHPDVWALYKKALTLFGPLPTVIERDNNIPTFEELIEEIRTAENLMEYYVKKPTEKLY